MKTVQGNKMMSYRAAFIKRGFDILLSFLGLLATFWIIGGAIVAARIDIGLSGLFRQKRIGLHGKEFEILKIRTMQDIDNIDTTITQSDDPRISRLGQFFRRTKIDELPQLWNVLKGEMSFVGPRPDVPGYADKLLGDDRLILTIRPGITGPATLKYRDEEEILARQIDPQKYNDEVIFPDKVRINLEYIKNFSLRKDIVYILQTFSGKNDLGE